ncbi:MAG TPA: MaoC family dehydratase N-terminal domain-containing protein [Acidimicrobiales bacterium]|nr:MaoC family dehydratase N-terminal domain-containing protein [Acidimicrobiales bacterium]
MSPVADPIADVEALVGQPQYEETAEFPVERGYIWTTCSSVENANPLFWDDRVAQALTGGPIAPPTMLSVWFRPHNWAPGRKAPHLPLQVHFDLKERLGLPEAVMTDNSIVFGEPVRPGDLLSTRQLLRSVSEEKTTRLGTGRFWVIDVEYENQEGELAGVESYTGFGYRRSARRPDTEPDRTAPPANSTRAHNEGAGAGGDAAEVAWRGERIEPALFLAEVAEGDRLPSLLYDVSATTVVLGALASRDWRPMHHDRDFAQKRNGTRDIFLNTPNQAAWFERFVTDWTGPHGRLGRMRFRMHGSVFPGDTMSLDAVVDEVGVDEVGCGWVGLDMTMSVGGELRTSCDARVAVPVGEDDNPWRRRADEWKP